LNTFVISFDIKPENEAELRKDLGVDDAIELEDLLKMAVKQFMPQARSIKVEIENKKHNPVGLNLR
jgi:hypothetical protein